MSSKYDQAFVAGLVEQLGAINGPCACESDLCAHWASEAGIILTAVLDTLIGTVRAFHDTHRAVFGDFTECAHFAMQTKPRCFRRQEGI